MPSATGRSNALMQWGNMPLSEPELTYRKVSNIRRTKYQNLNASRLIL